MNHIYRSIWSESRKAFVVTHEKAKTNGKPSSTRTGVASAVVMALSAMAAAPSLAASSCTGPGPATINITGYEGSTCVIANGYNVNVVAPNGEIAAPPAISITGTIASFSVTNNDKITGANPAIKVNTATITGNITNNAGGVIYGNSPAAIVYSKSHMTGGIVNNGTIHGNIAKAIHYFNSTMTGTIANGGLILSDGGTGGGAGIQLNALTVGGPGSTIGGINNTGAITGGSSGINIASHSTVSGGITNSGTITGITGNGIFLGYTGTINNGITNTGVISGASWAGVSVSVNSTITGGLNNSGTITGGSVGGVRVRSKGTLDITNTGTIQANGGGAGINVTVGGDPALGGGIVGMVTNSGTISGTPNAINVDAVSTLSNLNLTGASARVVGNVLAKTAAVSINSGATFTSEGTFDLDSFNIVSTAVFNMAHGVTAATGFTNAGTLAIAAGGAPTITGAYTQATTGVMRSNATNGTTYGKLVVSGSASLPASAKFRVVTGAPATCGGITSGTTLSGVISATSLTSTTFAAVTDDCTYIDFTAVKNGNAINLVAINSPGACGTANGVATAFVPSANLCASGIPSGVTVGDPWTWTCAASTTANCSAPNQTVPASGGTGHALISSGSWAVDPAQSAGFIPTTGHAKSPPSLPPGYHFPYGLLDFVLTGGSNGTAATITITYPGAMPSGAVYWKYGPSPAGYNCSGAACAAAHWYQMPPAQAVFAGNTVTLTITDGGVGDDDLTANGIIVDQGGGGVLEAAASIPTLSEWALLTLAGLMGLFGMDTLRRRLERSRKGGL